MGSLLLQCVVLCAVVGASCGADPDGQLCPHELDKSYVGFKTKKNTCVTFSLKQGRSSYDLANSRCKASFTDGTLYSIFSVSVPNPTYVVGHPIAAERYELRFEYSLPPVDGLPVYKPKWVILNGMQIIGMNSSRARKTISSRLVIQPADAVDEIEVDLKNFGEASLGLRNSSLIVDQTEQLYLIQGKFKDKFCLYLETEWGGAKQQYKWNVPGSCWSTDFDGFFCHSAPFPWCTVLNKTGAEAFCRCAYGNKVVKCGNVPCDPKQSFVGFKAATQCVNALAEKPRPESTQQRRVRKRVKEREKVDDGMKSVIAICVGSLVGVILVLIIASVVASKKKARKKSSAPASRGSTPSR